MDENVIPLTIERLDELGALEFAGEPTGGGEYSSAELCAYAEWHWLRGSGRVLGRLTAHGRYREFERQLRLGADRWLSTSGAGEGFIRVRRAQTDTAEPHWVQFLFELERAATRAGFSSTWAKEIVGAMGEMEENVHAHSSNAATGLVAYWVQDSVLELVVLDRGRGVLASLREAEEFAELNDHGTALMTAVQEGNSRYGTTSGRGWGFHELFRGLANSNARMRFRSGDHVLSVDGTSGIPGARLRQSATARGFLISVRVSRTRG